MTRLVIGNKLSSNISIVTVKEKAQLEDYQIGFPMAFQAMMFDSYVNNVFLIASDVDNLMQGITDIETVVAKGGFKFKEWIVSGKSIPEQRVSIKLPDDI